MTKIPGLDGAVTVVGNAELSDSDRRFIASSEQVIRFNDMNYALESDQTSVHVVRLPSAWAPRFAVDAPVWYVAPLSSMVEDNASFFTPVYEWQYRWAYEETMTVPRLFPSCDCGSRCLHNQTTAGPSTGAAIISALVESPAISTIHVVGMNWKGPSSLHIDFAWRDMVRSCCGKRCVIHPTLNDHYGTEWPASSIVTIGACTSIAFIVLVMRGIRWRVLNSKV